MGGTCRDSRSSGVKVRPGVAEDIVGIFKLYKRVAAIPGGLARLEGEIDQAYVSSFVTRSLARGIVQVAEDADGRVVGEIHAYSPKLYCFSHVLSELTMAVDPDAQGRGIGRLLFQSMLDRVVDERRDVTRVELIARESNTKALRFYRSLGFTREGRLVGRIRNIDGTLECDIPMAWQRPAVKDRVRKSTRVGDSFRRAGYP